MKIGLLLPEPLDSGLLFRAQALAQRLGCPSIELRGGRISRNLDYYDAATIMKQVGLLPTS